MQIPKYLVNIISTVCIVGYVSISESSDPSIVVEGLETRAEAVSISPSLVHLSSQLLRRRSYFFSPAIYPLYFSKHAPGQAFPRVPTLLERE